MDIFDFISVNLHRIFYAAAIVMALVRYPKYFDTPLKYFPILLMYTFLNETLGYIISYSDKYNFVWSDFYSTYNVVIYNIYNIVFFLYFFVVYRYYFLNKKHRNFALIAIIIFLISAIINPLVENFMLEQQTYTYVVGAALLICCIIFYFMEVYSKLGRWFLSRDLVSWVSLGLLIFYMGYLPIKISRYYSTMYGLKEAAYVRNIQIGLVIAMYSCFIIGFWRMRRRKVLTE